MAPVPSRPEAETAILIHTALASGDITAPAYDQYGGVSIHAALALSLIHIYFRYPDAAGTLCSRGRQISFSEQALQDLDGLTRGVCPRA